LNLLHNQAFMAKPCSEQSERWLWWVEKIE